MARWFKNVRLPKLGNPPVDRAKVFLVPTVWGVSDPKFVEQIKALCEDHVFDAGVHFADNLLTWCRNNSMLEDEAFVNAWWRKAFPRTFGFTTFLSTTRKWRITTCRSTGPISRHASERNSVATRK